LFADPVLPVMRIDMLDPPFPVYLLAAPINQIMFFAVALSFVRYKGVGLKELGLRKANVKVLTVASLAALPLPVYILQEVIFGPDPLAQLVAEAATPRNSLQLVALVAISLALVGPCEELAFRGFIQKGFENALSKRKGLLIASGLFALSHGLNTLYPVLPVFVGALCLGYAWHRTDGNTTVSALMHGVYDSIIFAVAYNLRP
jgi:membrane protease YdiL (CAAX protease family)